MTAKRLLTKLQLKSQAEQSILLESLCKSRLEEILLFAKPLFSYAKKFARQLGRGCFFQLWDSPADAAQSIHAKRPPLVYLPLESVQLLENEEAVQLIITMDIWTEFVALVGVRTAEDECVLVSSLFPACVSDDVFGHHSLTPSTPTTIPTAAPSVPPAFDPQTSSFFNLVPELTELIGDAAPLFDSMLLCPFSRDAHQRLLAAGGQAALLAADAVTAAFTATATATAPSQTGSLAAGLTILHEAPGGATYQRDVSLLHTVCARGSCMTHFPLPLFPATHTLHAARQAPAGTAWPADEDESVTDERVRGEEASDCSAAAAAATADDIWRPVWCAGCFAELYCSRACQAASWENEHGSLCKATLDALTAQKRFWASTSALPAPPAPPLPAKATTRKKSRAKHAARIHDM